MFKHLALAKEYNKVYNLKVGKLHANNFCSKDSRYRYGFNGQEKDDEVAGKGNSYTAEFWQYDPRSGRRWNVDPIVKPWESSYAAFSNNSIIHSDPLGLDVINGHKESRDKASDKLVTAKSNFSKFDGMSKKDIKKEGLKKEFKALSNELRIAQSNYDYEDMAYNSIEKLITDVKTGDRKLFDDVDGLTDEAGNEVNVFIYSENLNINRNDGKYKGGDTDVDFGFQMTNASSGISYWTVKSKTKGDNTVVVTVDKIANARHLAHEFGHTKYFVKKTTQYFDWLMKNPKQRGKGGHGKNDPSGDAAIDAERNFLHLPKIPK